MVTEALYIELQFGHDGENGDVSVRSADVPGLHLRGKFALSMRPLIESAIKRLFRDNRGLNVHVVWLSNASAASIVEDLPKRLALFKEAA